MNRPTVKKIVLDVSAEIRISKYMSIYIYIYIYIYI